MSADDWEHLRDLFHAVLERPGDERAAFLDEACGGDAHVREQIEAMVKAHEQTASLDEPVASRAGSGDGDPATGLRIGRYEVRSTIATGGMGTVYEATQDQPHRLVALKVVRRGAASHQAMKRFRHEAEILGRLRHPNIAQVYDAGTYDTGEGGQPYFAMELVKGRRLLQYCASKELGTRQRLEIFAKVCDAVQFAHHKGVIHRDLKPDNVLVDDFGEPKILDFGVARATDSDIQATTLQTDIGQLIGTVPYMSPEQVAGDPAELDTRSDVYSLGVVLYELLADRLPHDLRDRTIPEAVRIIGEDDPTPLSSVSRVFRGDLDTIAAKALEKEKDRRYQSAAELAADIRHYLGDEPIVARPASAIYQMRKFARRNKTLVGGVVAVFVVLVGGIVGVSLALADSRREAQRAEMINVFLEEILASPDPWVGKRELTVVELLDDAAIKVHSSFASHPEVASRLHFTIARAYMKLGELEKSNYHLEASVQAGERVLDDENPRLLEARTWLPQIYVSRGEPEKAVPIARDVLRLTRNVYGPTHAQTFRAVNLLGGVLRSIGDEESLAESELILIDGIEQARRSLPPERRMTADLELNLAANYYWSYRFSEAEPFAQAAMEWFQEHNWPKEACAPMTLLANVKGCAGDPEVGASLARDAYETRLESFGRAHHTTTASLHTLGLNLMWSDRLEEAEERFVEFLSIKRDVLGNQNPVGSAFWVARVQMLRGKIGPEEALPIVEKFVEVNTNPVRTWHGEWGLTTKAYCLVQLGRYGEAREVVEQHPEKLIEALPAGHFERRLHFQALAEMYEGLGQPDKVAEYRALLREAEGADASD
ncbi:MAG: serine/threonine protein kinase [Planctomycetota bacterium]|jgi:tetratricopeptide (TPR) repeat protein/serine/threonine-protein kinase RIO1